MGQRMGSMHRKSKSKPKALRDSELATSCSVSGTRQHMAQLDPPYFAQHSHSHGITRRDDLLAGGVSNVDAVQYEQKQISLQTLRAIMKKPNISEWVIDLLSTFSPNTVGCPNKSAEIEFFTSKQAVLQGDPQLVCQSLASLRALYACPWEEDTCLCDAIYEMITNNIEAHLRLHGLPTERMYWCPYAPNVFTSIEENLNEREGFPKKVSRLN